MKNTKSKKDMVASISARLLNISKASGRDHNAVLLQYFQECYLKRLSVSSYKDELILKGGLLFLVFHASSFRPTKDIDLLGLTASSQKEIMKNMICDISQISMNDGVKFYTEKLSIESITEENEYQGLRVKIEAKLGSIRKRIQIDIGFGDLVYPEPQLQEYPTLLGESPPEIMVYTKESVIAEKFHAIVKFASMTSRMKDFYDIVFMAREYPFQMNQLNKAIALTFERRGTDIKSYQRVLNVHLKQDRLKQKQWQSFMERHHLTLYDQFSEVVTKLENFIVPVCENDIEDMTDRNWNPKKWKWE
ncbi:MAG: nucleotidyl transferase AbiEii/AbiGii toxin family protein [Tissierellales bacterium]|nr:nucleotidyl transferase AbiEii/AbiGii toxin family protein [Tissierellales bacterium]